MQKQDISAQSLLLLGTAPHQIDEFPPSGSQRKYFRLYFDQPITQNQHTAIAAYNENITENQIFIHYTQHLHQEGVRVPQILATAPNNRLYFQQDLGDYTLLQHLQRLNPDERTQQLEPLYRQALSDLAFLQTRAGQKLDLSIASPHFRFDQMAMGWDLAYFKYWFLMPSRVVYDEYQLEKDFQLFTTQLSLGEADFFLFRDFQARNIMLDFADINPTLYYIDYQGARKGALSYDVASLLYQAKADLSEIERANLFQHYLHALTPFVPSHIIDDLPREYPNYVLLRMLQVLGSYGFRGFYERKPHFLSSIPYALRNIEGLMRSQPNLFAALPMLHTVLNRLIERFLYAPETRLT